MPSEKPRSKVQHPPVKPGASVTIASASESWRGLMNDIQAKGMLQVVETAPIEQLALFGLMLALRPPTPKTSSVKATIAAKLASRQAMFPMKYKIKAGG